jgi:dTDP-4-dehydrorhamnose 3,5-epimerase
MQVRELSIGGAYELTPVIHRDERGTFHEFVRVDLFEEALGIPFRLAQANSSMSAAGAIRGIHFSEVPPSQSKYVTVVRGAVLDVVVDIRVGSPTFGRWEQVALDDVDCKVIYLSEGLGHAFIALEDDTVVNYLCSTPYTPDREHAINVFDPDLGITWPTEGRDGRPLEHRLSPKDTTAPVLSDIRDKGVLPTMEQVHAFTEGLKAGWHPVRR